MTSPHFSQLVVLKFGGTSVASAARWRGIAAIVRRRGEAGERVLIVVSALSGVTNALQSVIDGADGGVVAADVGERHLALCAELGIEVPNALQRRLDALAPLATSEARDLRWQAELLAQGELLSSTIGAAFLEIEFGACAWLDARDWLSAAKPPHKTERALQLSALCEAGTDAAAAARLAALGDVAITQGFIVRREDGSTALLGRGGSDTSAALFGALLGAARVEIWTDVAGMFSANPREVPGARLLRRLDYEEAQEIATTGAKVLHPRCLSPLREAGVPLYVFDTARPDLPGTEVGSAPPVSGIKAVSARHGITLVSMETVGMWQQVGFLADVFDAFRRHGLSVDLIGSAETNVTVSLDPSENLLDSDVLHALCADLQQVCRVKVIAPCTAVTLVGRGMRSLMHRLSDLLKAVGERRVHLISQSSNDLNLTFVVEQADAGALVPRLHTLLVRAGMLETGDGVFGPTWESLYGEVDVSAEQVPWWQSRRDALIALADEGTPAYVYDSATAAARARGLLAIAALGRVYYAVKANPHAGLIRTFAELGVGFECVSPGELDRVREAVPGIDPARLLFTPNFAPRREYEDAMATGVEVTIDSLHPLQAWPQVFAGHSIKLRVDLGRGLGHHDKVRTGGTQSKFGIGAGDLDEARRLCSAHGIAVSGLHAHLGSGIFDASHWRDVAAELASLAERFAGVRTLNLGGGLGVPARAGEPALDLAALAAGLAEVREQYPGYDLWMEPGRYLAAECGVLLARVNQVKRKAGVAFVGVDAGMHTLLRPALYDAFHPVWNLSRLDQPATERVQVVGPICESGDVLARDRLLPETHEGDVLLIGVAGAYGAAMASRYNLRGQPRELLL
jgi:bifunctional diaminopimelate decarboxylase / aspartate kinase